MFKKMLMTGLLVATVLSVSACGDESGEVSGTAGDKSAESSTVESQPTEEETKEPAVEDSQTTEAETESSAEDEAEDEQSDFVSYIFSKMPVAAYEVTGLGVELNAEVYAENVIDPEYGDAGVIPFVKLDSSNTFTLFCLQAEAVDVDETTGSYYLDKATIHSPAGSSQWEANGYSCSDFTYPEIEGYASGYPCLLKPDNYYKYNEETNDGKIDSLVDCWTDYLRFAEIYHPDAPQEDTIYVIEMEVPSWDENHDEIDEVLTAMADIFEGIGATNIQEISVEEALKRFHIIVSEEGTD